MINRILCAWLILAACVAPGVALAQSGGRVTGAPDVSAESKQRSLAYFRMRVAKDTRQTLTADQLSRIEGGVRRQIESLGRFEMVQLPFETNSVREFVTTLQSYLQEHVQDIAKMRTVNRGEDYDFSYGETVVTGDSIRQVLNSGYAYEIDLGSISLSRRVETYNHKFQQLEIATRAMARPAPGTRLPRKLRLDPETRNLVYISLEPMTDDERREYLMLMGIDINAPDYKPEGGTEEQQAWHKMIDDLFARSKTEPPVDRWEQRQGEYMVASMPIAVRFFRINVVDDNNNIVPISQAVTAVSQGTMQVSMSGRQTGEYLLKEDTQTWLELLIMNKRRLAAVRAEAKRREEAGTKQAIDGAAANIPGGIESWIRTVPEFKIRAMVSEIHEGVVFEKPGRKEGLRVDDYAHIYTAAQGNQKAHVGWGLVTKLGPGYVASSAGSSAADLQQTEVTLRSGAPTRGDMLEEYAMFGVNVDLGVGGEFLLGSAASNSIGGSTLAAQQGMFLINLHPGFNWGRLAEISQVWVGLDLRLGLGGNLLNWAIGLEVKKKFIFGALCFDIGISGGITGFAIGGGQANLQAVANHLFGQGLVGSQAQADQVVADNALTSPLMFFVAVQPRLQYFFSPSFHAYVQINLQFTSDESVASIGGNDLSGANLIPGFRWNQFGLGATLGASFEF